MEAERNFGLGLGHLERGGGRALVGWRRIGRGSREGLVGWRRREWKDGTRLLKFRVRLIRACTMVDKIVLS